MVMFAVLVVFLFKFYVWVFDLIDMLCGVALFYCVCVFLDLDWMYYFVLGFVTLHFACVWVLFSAGCASAYGACADC